MINYQSANQHLTFHSLEKSVAAVVSNVDFLDQLKNLVNLSPTWAITTGILLTVIGSCLMAAGSVVMKLGIHAETRRSGALNTAHPFCQPLWWLGFSAYSIGALLHAFALAFAPASVLAPMNSLGLVANAVVAATVLGEPFGWKEGLGTFGTFIGVTLCAGASFLPQNGLEIVSGLESWSDPWYLVYVGCCSVISIAVLMYVNNEELSIIDKKWDKHYDRHVARGHIELVDLRRGATSTTRGGQQSQLNTFNGDVHNSYSHRGLLPETRRLIENANKEVPDGTEIGAARRSPISPRSTPHHNVTAAGATQLDTQQPEDDEWIPDYPAHLGMAYGLLAGLIGAQCVLELKEVSESVKLAVTDEAIWFSPLPYVSSVLCAISIFLQLHFLNFGLSRGEATNVVPTYYVFWTIFGTVGGFAKFHEYSGFGLWQIVLFAAGLLMTLFSIGLMAVQEMKKMRDEIDNVVPVLTGDELETEESRVRRNRQLRTGVPLAFGYSIVPIGNLGGRLRTARGSRMYPFRRTRSFQELLTRRTDSDGLLRQSSGAMPYNWTVAGAYNFHLLDRETPSLPPPRRNERFTRQQQAQLAASSGHAAAVSLFPGPSPPSRAHAARPITSSSATGPPAAATNLSATGRYSALSRPPSQIQPPHALPQASVLIGQSHGQSVISGKQRRPPRSMDVDAHHSTAAANPKRPLRGIKTRPPRHRGLHDIVFEDEPPPKYSPHSP